jgi:hypothetical protein
MVLVWVCNVQKRGPGRRDGAGQDHPDSGAAGPPGLRGGGVGATPGGGADEVCVCGGGGVQGVFRRELRSAGFEECWVRAVSGGGGHT